MRYDEGPWHGEHPSVPLKIRRTFCCIAHVVYVCVYSGIGKGGGLLGSLWQQYPKNRPIRGRIPFQLRETYFSSFFSEKDGRIPYCSPKAYS